MKEQTKVLLCAPLALVLACGGEAALGPLADGPPLEEAEAAIGAKRLPIVGGWLDNEHPTVGMVRTPNALCTGTLIGKLTVLTAAHCTPGGNVSFEIAGQTIAASRVANHPSYCGGNCNDLAVVTLSWDPGIPPSPLYTSPPQVGQAITLVGYGKTSEYASDHMVKRVGYNRVSTVGGSTFSFQGTSNVCNGDSGGPSFIGEYLAGIHSTKMGSCGTGGTDMRVDHYQQWIRAESGGGAGGGCADQNQTCSYWASIGECQRNPSYMLTNCCASCQASPCTDQNPYCSYWASIGECQNNPGYMLTYCCASCQGRR